MFVLKIKGKARIPDYVQLRDDNFSLLAYFRVDRPEKALQRAGLTESEKTIMEFVASIPFGKMMRLDLVQ